MASVRLPKRAPSGDTQMIVQQMDPAVLLDLTYKMNRCMSSIDELQASARLVAPRINWVHAKWVMQEHT